MRALLLSSIGAAVALLVSSTVFHGNVYSLIVWAIAGLFVGFLTKSKKESLIAGGVYGFILSYMFMTLGYKGTRPYISVVVPFALLGLFGALCGLILGFFGQLFTKLKRKYILL
jgi:hypothetical protein